MNTTSTAKRSNELPLGDWNLADLGKSKAILHTTPAGGLPRRARRYQRTSEDRTRVCLCDLVTATCQVWQFSPEDGKCERAELSCDGRQVLVWLVGDDWNVIRDIQLHDAETGKLLHKFDKSDKVAMCNDALFVVARENRSIVVRSSETGLESSRLSGPPLVTAVRPVAKARFALLADGKGTSFWDLEQSQELSRFEGIPISWIQISKDLRHAIFQKNDGTVRIWRLPFPDPVLPPALPPAVIKPPPG